MGIGYPFWMKGWRRGADGGKTGVLLLHPRPCKDTEVGRTGRGADHRRKDEIEGTCKRGDGCCQKRRRESRPALDRRMSPSTIHKHEQRGVTTNPAGLLCAESHQIARGGNSHTSNRTPEKMVAKGHGSRRAGPPSRGHRPANIAAPHRAKPSLLQQHEPTYREGTAMKQLRTACFKGEADAPVP